MKTICLLLLGFGLLTGCQNHKPTPVSPGTNTPSLLDLPVGK